MLRGKAPHQYGDGHRFFHGKSDLEDAAHGFVGSVEILKEIGIPLGILGISLRDVLLKEKLQRGLAGIHFHYLVDQGRLGSHKGYGISRHGSKIHRNHSTFQKIASLALFLLALK
jgi:hypothetical protein